MARSRGSLTSSGAGRQSGPGFRTQTREPAERTCSPVSATSSLWESGQVPNLSEPRFLSATCGHHLPQRQLAREHTVDIRCRVVTYLRGCEAPEGGDDTGRSHRDIPCLQPRHRLAARMAQGGGLEGPGEETKPAGHGLQGKSDSPRDGRHFLKGTLLSLGRGPSAGMGETAPGLCWAVAWCLPDSRTRNLPGDVTAKRPGNAHRAPIPDPVTKRGHPTAIGVTSTDLCPTPPRLARPT